MPNSNPNPLANVSPKFSVVVPTYNRPDCLRHCLHSLAQIDYPREAFEVIVVDDGSPTCLGNVVAEVEDRLTVRLIRQANAGPASARNTGALAARGEYLVFTDDDCQPTPDWLTALETAIAAAPKALIGGRTFNALANNLYSTASQLLIDYLYDYFNQSQGTAMFFASNNFAVPSDLFRDLGGFDQQFPLAAAEDREFCDRWLQHNLSMAYAPEMQVYHNHHLSLKRFWRQHFNYGRGAYCFHQVKAHRANGSVKVEPLRFYWQLLTYPLSQHQPQGITLLGLLLLSQVANVVGFLWERSQGKPAPASAAPC